ncbi:hypothetical protein AB0L20_32170, partial [Streptomyces albidoflavus]|uniref:hypothetical protein n=1 Tax=Streptomyces albidoflavus TaxID=1886 RepID=UPI0034489152
MTDIRSTADKIRRNITTQKLSSEVGMFKSYASTAADRRDAFMAGQVSEIMRGIQGPRGQTVIYVNRFCG